MENFRSRSSRCGDSKGTALLPTGGSLISQCQRKSKEWSNWLLSHRTFVPLAAVRDGPLFHPSLYNTIVRNASYCQHYERHREEQYKAPLYLYLPLLYTMGIVRFQRRRVRPTARVLLLLTSLYFVKCRYFYAIEGLHLAENRVGLLAISFSNASFFHREHCWASYHCPELLSYNLAWDYTHEVFFITRLVPCVFDAFLQLEINKHGSIKLGNLQRSKITAGPFESVSAIRLRCQSLWEHGIYETQRAQTTHTSSR